ncbi:hypothetical protein ACQ5SK_26600 [Bradyrhizobium japonicum]
MREWWVPIAALAQAPKPAGALSLGGTLQGVLHAFMRIADPLKGGLYFGLIAILVFFGYVQPRRETALEEGRRRYQAAAGQVGSDRLVSDAVASLARLINAGTFTTERDVARMSDVARFGLQRLLTANEVLLQFQREASSGGPVESTSRGIGFCGSTFRRRSFSFDTPTLEYRSLSPRK